MASGDNAGAMQGVILNELTDSEAVRRRAQKERDRVTLKAMVDVANKIIPLVSKKDVKSKKNTLNMDNDDDMSLVRISALRQARQNRMEKVTSEHVFILKTASLILDLPLSSILEGVYESDMTVDILECIMAEGGRGCLIVCAAQSQPPNHGSGGENTLTTSIEVGSKSYISDGVINGTLERCVVIYRIKNNEMMNPSTIADEFFYAYVDMHPLRSNVVKGICNLMEKVYLPCLLTTNNWGDLNPPHPESEQCIRYYILKCKKFMDYLIQTKIDLGSCVLFPIDVNLYKESLSNIKQIEACIKNKDVMEHICGFVKHWIKMITLELVRSWQVRCEPSTVGPKSELIYWRRLLVTFTSILEHLDSKTVQCHIQPLHMTNSKLIKKWVEVCNEVTNNCNEAAEVVKYLYALDDYCEPLYRCEPTNLPQHIPALMYSIRMIFTVSTHFNKNNQISTLLNKVSNQVLFTCKEYLTDHGRNTIYTQPKIKFIEKAKVCLALYVLYRQAYGNTQKDMANSPDEKPFDCSTMYVFGKLEALKTRILKIINFFETCIKYDILNRSTLPDIDEHANKVNEFYRTMSNKSYDALDFRKPNFDEDFATYKANIAKQEVALENNMIENLKQCPTVEIALNLLKRYEKLQLECLYIDDAYYDLSTRFANEVRVLRDIYNSARMNPELSWNMTPVAGRIFWIRFLFEKLRIPMEVFKNRAAVIKHPYNQPLIKMHNSLVLTFTEYEIVYHTSWMRNVIQIRLGLTQPVYMRDPNTFKLKVNLHMYIPECIRESQYMWQLQLHVPAVAQIVTFCKSKLFFNYERLHDLIRRNDSIRERIPFLFLPLLKHILHRIDKVFAPGLSRISWTSLEIDSYCDRIDQTLDKVDLFIEEIKRMTDVGINKILRQISRKNLIYIPDKPILPSEFLEANLCRQKLFVADLQDMSSQAESGVIELVNKLLDSMPFAWVQEVKETWYTRANKLSQVASKSDLNIEKLFQEVKIEDCTESNTRQECMNLFQYFNVNCIEAVVKLVQICVQDSLLQLKFVSLNVICTTLCKKYGKYVNEKTHVKEVREKNTSIFDETCRYIKSDDPIGRKPRGTKILSNVSSSSGSENTARSFKTRLGRNTKRNEAGKVIVKPRSPSLFVHGETVKRCIASFILVEEEYNTQRIQEKIALNFVLDILKDVYMWGQLNQVQAERETFGEVKLREQKMFRSTVAPGRIVTYYRTVSANKNVIKTTGSILGMIHMYKPEVEKLFEKYRRFSNLWSEQRQVAMQQFVNDAPLIATVREKFVEFQKQRREVVECPDHVVIGSLQIDCAKIKLGLLLEADEWPRTLSKSLCNAYKTRALIVHKFIKKMKRLLNRKLNYLDDIRKTLHCLDVIREQSITFDLEIDSIVEIYGIVRTFEGKIPNEDIRLVDDLRFEFNSLLNLALKVHHRIVDLQKPQLKKLREDVSSFNKDFKNFDEDFDSFGPMTPGITARCASDRVILFQSRFDELWRRYISNNSGEKLFGLAVNDYPRLHKKKKELSLLNKLYHLYLAVMNSIEKWYETPLRDVDFESMVAQLQQFEFRFQKLPQDIKGWSAYLELKRKINDFTKICSLLKLMCHRCMKDRHWKSIEGLMPGTYLDVESEYFTLVKAMEAPLLEHREDVEHICAGAVKEKEIEARLAQVIVDWSTVKLSFADFKQRGKMLIKSQETSDIINMLEDSLVELNCLASDRYNLPYKRDINLWINKLVITGEILEKWLHVQNLWMYMEAVFVGGDISMRLPKEAKRFQMIEKTYLKIMHRGHGILNVVECCTSDDTLKQLLPYLLDQLEACQKSLSSYLEAKRLIFARFFFVSDAVLLEILGQASNPRSIRDYLPSLFDAVDTATFDEKDHIVAINSSNGESVFLDRAVNCLGGVEIWLNVLLETVKITVKNKIANFTQTQDKRENKLLDVYMNMPGQVCLVTMQVTWTASAENALKKSRSDKSIMRITSEKFHDLLNALIKESSKDLSPLFKTRVESMIILHMHQRDVFDNLMKVRIRSTGDFEWLKQTRLYLNEETADVLVSIMDINLAYQNEYLGVKERLVTTPCTDVCFITLAQAVGMSMGGTLVGAAATGKTETAKEMGRTLGKLVIVFNCSGQMDVRGLGRMCKGLAQSGAWGCFDEFNRIALPVLSVAAQQMNTVLTARKHKKSCFTFSDGDMINLNNEFAFITTMSSGSAEKQELPENLKMLFRPVAMTMPDIQLIIRVKLASCGFKEYVILGRKLYTLFKFCEELLSKQAHYDFGLRNILPALKAMGLQKRSNPDNTEATIVVQVLKEINAPKLIDEDVLLFTCLIEDLFPGITLEQSQRWELHQAVANVCSTTGCINNPVWNIKIIQLYETSLARHGFMVMGPSGSGKTSSIQTLCAALTLLGTPHKEIRMNPKAINADQMFGHLDTETNVWADGIFSALWRKAVNVKRTEITWIVLDGPVDASWVENLNSVLDDNKSLTLANGDRIPMAPNSKLVFETDSIDNASPMTVSRLGIVHYSSSVLKWDIILESWLRTRTPQEANSLKRSFMKVYDDVHTFVQQKLETKMQLLETIYIRQCIDVLLGQLDAGHDRKRAYTDCQLERMFLFAMMWSLGSVLEPDGRIKMSEFMKNLSVKLKFPRNGMQMVADPFDYRINDDGEWEHWSEIVEDYSYPANVVPDFASIFVPLVDNVRIKYLIDLIAKQNKALLLIGAQSTAKTATLRSFMTEYGRQWKLFREINFSYATTPTEYQGVIESYLVKRVNTTYGPPNNKEMIVFIDDINMPSVNQWGDQITNEMVRQMMATSGFYSVNSPGEFLTIADTQLVAAMTHPGGGRNDIPHRLKRQFNIFNCTLPSRNCVDNIFEKIATGYFCQNRFDEAIVRFVPLLVPLTRIIWQKVKIKMPPTPSRFHYVFNLRDMSRIWEGILRIQRDACKSISTLLKLWYHECNRVIADRFVSCNDKSWFKKMVRRTLDVQIPEVDEELQVEDAYFVNFLRGPSTTDVYSTNIPPMVYEEVISIDGAVDKLNYYMEKFNEHFRGEQLDLIFFHDAMVHLFIISRIISTPRGNALLVGVGGSGKRSLAKLASFIAGYKFYQIQQMRTCNVDNFVEDIKGLCRVAVLEEKGTSFIFTDNDFEDDRFMGIINNILCSGEVANLYRKDEMEEMLHELTPSMRKNEPERMSGPDALYNCFIARSRANLHVVVSFSSVGERLYSTSMKFPGLMSGCTIDWFQKWSTTALEAVSCHFLDEFEVVGSLVIKKQMNKVLAFVHNQVHGISPQYFERFRRRIHVTPKSFLSFLKSYKKMYKEKLNYITGMESRVRAGLIKLSEVSNSVNGMKNHFPDRYIGIRMAAIGSKTLLNLIEKVAVEIVTAKTKVDTGNNKMEVIKADTTAVAEKLKAASLALETAEAALLTINPVDVVTITKLENPPFLMKLIMDAVCILFGKKISPVTPDDENQFLTASWSESYKLLSDSRFLQNLKNFPLDEINAEMIDLLQPYFKYKLYTFEAAKTRCAYVAGLLSWTIAMADFYEVNKDMLTLEDKLAKQEGLYAFAKRELECAEDELRIKEEELEELQSKLEDSLSLNRSVIDDTEMDRVKLEAATALIDGLSAEKERWTQQCSLYQSQIDKLVGDVVLMTGFVTYCGPVNQEVRMMLLDNWKRELMRHGVPVSAFFNISDQLTNSTTIAQWNLDGLPNDDFSIQNAIIVTKTDRIPLLIDPQGQGRAWIYNMEKDNGLTVSSLNHKHFRNYLEDCLKLGRPLLIEVHSEDLDSALNNILEKRFFNIGTAIKVNVNNEEIDVSKNFRLYITTKLPNPAYEPDIYARTSVVDFTVTMNGLEDQLLHRAILKEKVELENDRKMLLAEVAINERKMAELEQNLLDELASIDGSLVEYESFAQVLDVTRTSVNEVNELLEIARETEFKINSARELLRPVAVRGSALYFILCNMSLVCPMYQTSLALFLERFDTSMERSERSPVITKRVAFIIEYLTYEIFSSFGRGFFAEHKYLFALLMALNLDMQRGYITYNEYQSFIKGGAALESSIAEAKPHKWVTDISWLNLVQLSSLRYFRDILTQVTQNDKIWKNWLDKETPEEETIPDGYDKLDEFRKLLIIRCWRQDRLIPQSQKYISQSLGKRYIESAMTNYELVVEESRPLIPIIVFITKGDPTPSIERTAKQLGVELCIISLGQGQEVPARKLLEQAVVEGTWVLLQNCHLALEYMQEMTEMLIEMEINPSKTNPNFRIWITSEVHPEFPILLLQQSIKYASDSPSGIKADLMCTYTSINQDFLDGSDSPYYKPLVYAVSFLHAVLRERCKFGPLGWSAAYEFNIMDWQASCIFIQKYLDKLEPGDPINWTVLRYMVSEVQYGGRVSDYFDQQVLCAFAKLWFNDGLFSKCSDFYKGYDVLNFKLKEDYVNEIGKLKGNDSPQVFGLHTNADIMLQGVKVQDLLDSMLSIQPKENRTTGGESRSVFVYRQSEELLAKLPPNYDPVEVKERLHSMGQTNAMVIFLWQEIIQMQRVLTLVRSTLTDLLLAIGGTTVMNEVLRNSLDDIYQARVPMLWVKSSWLSSSLAVWFKELLERNTQLSIWCLQGRPSSFWMARFFNPQGFLAAMKQEVVRNHSDWTLDMVSLHNAVTKYAPEDVKGAPLDGVFVHGLYLDGAGWDRRSVRLTELPHKALVMKLPVVHVYAVNSIAPKGPKLYMCPVYKNPMRTDKTFITTLWLPTSTSSEHWIMRGVAIICDIN